MYFMGCPIVINESGYPVIFLNGRMVFVHRKVAELKYGRKLRRGEVVHHIDHNKLNYSPENLMIFQSQQQHMNYHHGGAWWIDQEGVAHANPPMKFPKGYQTRQRGRFMRKPKRFGLFRRKRGFW